MGELAELLQAWRAAADRGEDVVLATVVKTAGSSYRRPGARMLFSARGPSVGLVSGGCLEDDLAERARQVLLSGTPSTVVYDMRSPDDIVWGLGLGCDGEVRVLLERLAAGEPPGWLAALEAAAVAREATTVVTVFDAAGADVGLGALAVGALRQRLVTAASGALTRGRSSVCRVESAGGAIEALVEYVAPPIALVVFGAGRDAVPVVRLACELGWPVTLADHRPAHARGERFPGSRSVRLVDYTRLDDAELPVDSRTAVLIMSHHFLNDVAALRYALSSPAPYIGLLGPRRRAENLLAELEKAGDAPAADAMARIHGPVGVDIGAETPEEIALSALAEIRAVMAGRGAGFLKHRAGPLHDPLP